MNLNASPCDWLDASLMAAGAAKWGVSAADEVSPEAREQYLDFIAAGHHGCMDYLARNLDARFSTDLILKGARSIISVAFAYHEAPEPASPDHPRWAAYALGDDYHTAIRRRLDPVAAEIDRRLGATSRVTVDTAPVMERYRAVRAGVGIRGRNGMLIIPGIGSRVFLAEIFTTASLPLSVPSPDEIACLDCGRCLEACPTGALCGDGTLDTRLCLSCLTIEYRGELPDGLPVGDRVYGCDTCRRVCPHENMSFTEHIPEFTPRQSITALTLDKLAAMTAGDFSTIFHAGAVKRVKHAGLLRNVKYLLKQRKS